jgi:hypothetical protein
MKRMIGIVAVLTWLGIGNIVSAEELLPWQTEGIEISTPGVHSVKIDDRVLFFEVPTDLATHAGRASEVISRGDKYEDWLKRKGEYEKYCFGMSKNFYTLGIPLLGIDAQFSIQAMLHVKTSPANRDLPNLPDVTIPGSLGAMYKNPGKGDFSKPEELRAYMERTRGVINHKTPIEEVIINNRKWHRYYKNSKLYPDELIDYYITGLAPDRYLEVQIRLYPVPVYTDRYPRYVPEDQRPGWMKKAVKYKEQVISSLRITAPEGSKEPDLYAVEALMPPTVSP